jgi:hypothetical protein
MGKTLIIVKLWTQKKVVVFWYCGVSLEMSKHYVIGTQEGGEETTTKEEVRS